MLHKKGFVPALVALIVLIGINTVFSQEQGNQAQEPAVATEQANVASAAPAVPAANPEFQWVWGEVSSVDPNKSEFVVKYLDYETDQEKEMTISVDDKTTYENAKAFADIKPKSTLSIDYVVGLDNKNIAKNISIEEVEVSPESGKWTDVPQAQTEPVATPMNQ